MSSQEGLVLIQIMPPCCTQMSGCHRKRVKNNVVGSTAHCSLLLLVRLLTTKALRLRELGGLKGLFLPSHPLPDEQKMAVSTT